MQAIHYIPLRVAEWNTRLQLLTAQERGIFLGLVLRQVEQAAPIALSAHDLARLCATTPKQLEKCLTRLMDLRLISCENRAYFFEFVTEEIEKVREKSRAAQSAAFKRHEKTVSNQLPLPSFAQQTQCARTATQNQNQIKNQTHSESTSDLNSHWHRAAGAVQAPEKGRL